MSWAVASVLIALFVSAGAVACFRYWAIATHEEWRHMHLIEIAKTVRTRAQSLTGHTEPENFFDLDAERERDARNRRGAKPFVAVDNDQPPNDAA